jgi:hypothetical protein
LLYRRTDFTGQDSQQASDHGYPIEFKNYLTYLCYTILIIHMSVGKSVGNFSSSVDIKHQEVRHQHIQLGSCRMNK